MRSAAIALAAAWLAAGCGKNTSAFDAAAAEAATGPVSAVMVPPAGGGMPPGMGGMPPGMGGMPPGHPAVPPAWTITGTLDVKPELRERLGETDVVYVTARVPGQRMPVAVARIERPAYPVEFTLEPTHSMGEESGDAGGGYEISARLSRAGTAGPAQPGDLEGRADGLARPGAAGIAVTLDTIR